MTTVGSRAESGVAKRDVLYARQLRHPQRSSAVHAGAYSSTVDACMREPWRASKKLNEAWVFQ